MLRLSWRLSTELILEQYPLYTVIFTGMLESCWQGQMVLRTEKKIINIYLLSWELGTLQISKIIHNICQWQQQKFEIWTWGLVYWRLGVTAVSSAVDFPLGSANCFKWDEKSCCDCSLVIVENCAMLCIAKSNTQPCWKLFFSHAFSRKYIWC